MDVDDSAEDLEIVEENSEREVQPMISNRQRYSFGLDLTECTLDCSLELCDTSIASNMHHEKFSPMSNLSSNLNVQESFEMDESLGILTPERMKEFLDSTTNIAPHNLDLPLHSGKMAHQECRVDQTPSPEELPLDPVVEWAN